MLTMLFPLALADLPPLEDYVETCTVANHGTRCKTCSAYHAGREDCEALEKQGYHKVCKTRGASVWDEVLCPGPVPAPAPGEAIPEVTPARPAPVAPASVPPPPHQTAV